MKSSQKRISFPWGTLMSCNGALANTSTLSCFTSCHLESNEGIPLSDRCWHDGACPQKRQVHWELAGSIQRWIPICVLLPLCTVDTETLWMACLRKSAVPQKVRLASNFLCLLYFFVSKLELFTRPPWEWQSNVDETKYPALTDKTSRREWVCACACVCLQGRDSTVLKCWHLLQALAGMECDTLLYTKGLGPCSRHKKTSIGPPPWRQHTHTHTQWASLPNVFFFPAINFNYNLRSFLIPWYW